MSRPFALGLALVSLALAILFAALTAPNYLFTGDPSHYVGLARSLVNGGGYVFNGRPEVKYPPGLPVLLTPAALLFDGGFAAIARWAAVLASLVFPMTYFFSRHQGSRHALGIAVLTIASTPFLSLTTGNPMADPVYLAISLGLLVWWDRTIAPGGGSFQWRSAATGALLVSLTVATRTIGIAAVVALTAAVVIRQLRASPGGRIPWGKALVPVLAGWLYLAAWLAWTVVQRRPWYPGEFMNSYVQQLALRDPHIPDLGTASLLEIARRPLQNVLRQSAHLAELLTQLPWVRPSWFSPLVLAPIVLVLMGWWHALRSTWGLAPLYFASYSALVLLWPFDEGPRFLVPVIPLIWVYLPAGLRLALRILELRPSRCRTIGLLLSGGALSGMVLTRATGTSILSRQDMVAGGFWVVAFVALALRRSLPEELSGPRLQHRAAALIGPGIVAYAAIGLTMQLPDLLRRAGGGPPTQATSLAVAHASEWILNHTPGDAVIQVTFPDRVHFATGRRTVVFPVTSDPATLLDVTTRYQPDYLIVLDSTEYSYFLPVDATRLRILNSRLAVQPTVAFRFPGGAVFKLAPEHPTSP